MFGKDTWSNLRDREQKNFDKFEKNYPEASNVRPPYNEEESIFASEEDHTKVWNDFNRRKNIPYESYWNQIGEKARRLFQRPLFLKRTIKGKA